MIDIWVEEGKERLGAINLSVERKGDNTIEIKGKKYISPLNITVTGGMLVIRTSNLLAVLSEFFFPSKFKKMMSEWFTAMAREAGAKTVLFITGDRKLEEKKWMPMDALYAYDLVADTSGDYYMDIEPGFMIEKIYSVKVALEELIRQKDTTTVIDEPYNGDFELYHYGKSAKIQHVYKEGKFYLSYNGKDYEIDESGIASLYQKIKNDQRVKNILNPPDYHFKKVFLYYGKQSTEQIHEHLLTVYTPNEIEEYCAKIEDGVDGKKIDGLFIMFFMNYYFLMMDGECYMYKEEKEAKEKAREMLVEPTIKKMESSIDKALTNLCQ